MGSQGVSAEVFTLRSQPCAAATATALGGCQQRPNRLTCRARDKDADVVVVGGGGTGGGGNQRR